MIYIRIGCYLVPILFMYLALNQETQYSSYPHVNTKGIIFSGLVYFSIDKFFTLFTDGVISFYYIPCFIRSLFLSLYFSWTNFNAKYSKADKIYMGKFSTIKSLINAGTVYEAKYNNFYVLKKSEDKWYHDDKIQITLPFCEYIRYYFFLTQKNKTDYQKKQAESNLSAANAIKNILSDYVKENTESADKYFAQAKDITEQMKTGQEPAPLNVSNIVESNTGKQYAVIEIFNPDSANSKMNYKYFFDYDSAVSHLKKRVEDEKVESYLQGNPVKIHSSDDIWSLSAFGTWGYYTKWRWAIVRIKK